MTYDPYRNNEPPHDPYRRYRTEDRTSAGAAILLGALLLAAIGGFIYFYSGPSEQSIATDMRPPITQPSTTGSAPAPETTGASSNMPASEPKVEPKAKPAE